MLTLLLLACLRDLAPEGTWVGDDSVDRDGDGFPETQDCDDLDDAVHPGAEELCDGLDNNCSGEVDDVLEPEGQPFWDDEDGDGFGAGQAIVACEQPGGWSAEGGDCDDEDPRIHPDADELCDGLDNNCDGDTDEDSAVDAVDWFSDNDHDGWGTGAAVHACDPPSGHVQHEGDCDDGEPMVNPGMEEACDTLDNDCSGLVDDGEVCPCTMDWKNSAYMFCPGEANWWDARAFCLIYGYDLLTVNNENENTWIDDRLNAWGGRWWAGYNDIASEGSWGWSSGANASYTNWDDDQPNNWGASWTDGQDCVLLNDRDGGRWNDAECDYGFWFICES